MYGKKGMNGEMSPMVMKGNVGVARMNPKSGMDMNDRKMVMSVVQDPVTKKNSLEKSK